METALEAPQKPTRMPPLPPRRARLSRTRIALALTVAATADLVQLAMVQFGWIGPDQFIDVIAMGLTCWILGFHVLLLPTFALEFIPAVGMFPTWTGCVVAVIALRKRAERSVEVV